MVEPVQVQRRPSTRIDKMIGYACYGILREIISQRKGDNSHVVIDRVGAYEVRLLEIPSTNARGAASLWVELYDRGLRAGVDSCKCKDVGEAIEVTRFFMTHATRLKNEAA
jgi:hypothetical protein